MKSPLIEIINIIYLVVIELVMIIFCSQVVESGEPNSAKRTHVQPLKEQDKAVLDWVSGTGRAAPSSRKPLPAKKTADDSSLHPAGIQSKGKQPPSPGTNPSNNSGTNTGSDIAKHPSQLSMPSGNGAGSAEGIGDLEAIIKTIKQEQSTVDLKSIGDSIILLRKKITDNPQDPALRQRLATLLYLAGDYEGAVTEYKHALALKPTNYVAHALLGRVMADVGEREASQSEFQNAIALAPNTAPTHSLYADSLMARGDLSEGINEYRRSIGIKPTCSALTGLAEALMVAQDVDGAVKAARQAVSEEPNSSEAHVTLTKALLMAGDTQSSSRTAREALLLNPNSAATHIAVGRSLYASGKVEAAAEEFKQAVDIDPLNAEARNDLGYALYGKGDIGNALNQFRLALRLNPHSIEARNNLEIAIHALSGRKGN